MSLVVIEGGEGAGKSSVIQALTMEFTGYPIVYIREPGGTGLGEEVRNILMNRKMAVPAEFFLFLSAGAQLAEEVTKPALAMGKHVIYDRYRASTYAYQVVGRERCDLTKSFWNAQFLFPLPDLHVYLVVSPEVGLQRKVHSGETLNRFDKDTLDFHRRVNAGYDEYFASIESSGARVLRIDATAPEGEVHDAVIDVVSPFIRKVEFAFAK